MYQKILIVCVDNTAAPPPASGCCKKAARPPNCLSRHPGADGNDADFQAIKTALRHGVVIAGTPPANSP